MNHKKNPQHNRGSDNHDYWMFGRHAVLAAIGNTKRRIHEIYVTAQTAGDVEQSLAEHQRNIKLSIKKRHELDELFPHDAVHQGIVARTSPLPVEKLAATKDMRQLLILDHVTDPHNIGAIWRTAAAFGTEAIITTRDSAPSENGTWAKNASGTLEILPNICVTNLASTIKELKKQGFWIIGMEGSSPMSIKDAPDYDKVAVIMGAEGKGLRDLTQKQCDLLVHLPISSTVESLNVSNAAAIALYELFTL